jgi:competence protein ComEA
MSVKGLDASRQGSKEHTKSSVGQLDPEIVLPVSLSRNSSPLPRIFLPFGAASPGSSWLGNRHRFFVHALVLALLFISPSAFAQKSELPDGAGKDVMLRVCGQCHAATMVLGKGNTRDGWTQVVGEMVARGAQGSDDDFGAIVDYLTANFPPQADVQKVNVNKADATALQSGLQLTAKDASAIVDYRKQNGDFKTLDDLKKVPGIDAAKLDSEKQKISF